MKPDLIGLIEAIYAPTPDEQVWVNAVGVATERSLDLGLGTMAYAFQADPVTGPKIFQATARGRFGEELLRSARAMVAEQGVNSMVGFHTQIGLLSRVVEPQLSGADFIERHFRAVGGVGGAEDVLGIVGADASGTGMVLSALVPAGWRLTDNFRRRWGCVVSHLATGRRLRARGNVAEEAILDGSGVLHDAVGPARSRDARVALRQAARAIDRARTRRSSDPEAGVTAWRALVEARWSLVDRFESDGRRYLIAKPNPPQPPPVRGLTERQRAVVALAALGRSNKQIAYELGLSVGSVGIHLLRAQRRLGVSSRSGLIREFLRTLRRG